MGRLAWRLGSLNDETFFKCTPEERYQRTVTWIEKQLLPVPVESGQVLVEYALILLLVVLVCVLLLAAIGVDVSRMYQHVVDKWPK